MSDLLSNPWVVGIGGGLLSGALVTFGSRLIISKKENKEYYQSVRLANNEVIYAMRHSISEEYVPEVSIIKSLINANSRKFKVQVKDMYNVLEVNEEIIKEIMDTSFISNQKKDELFRQVEHLMIDLETDNEISTELKDYDLEYRDYKKRLLNYLTASTGIMASFMTFILAFYDTSNLRLPFATGVKQFDLLSILIVVMSIIMLYVYTLTTIMNKRKRLREKTRYKMEKERTKIIDKEIKL